MDVAAKDCPTTVHENKTFKNNITPNVNPSMELLYTRMLQLLFEIKCDYYDMAINYTVYNNHILL